ncbi:MAG: ABC transporter permease [Defluviitaleaceae bacterium]|nr:ABC transporter permease [Defluviitaleaceae bacterium]
MHVFKRGFISIIRRPIKFLILFLVTVVLGSLTLGAVSISRAIRQTEVNLLQQIPPVATIRADTDAIVSHFERYDEWLEIESLNRGIFELMGQLPYVRLFDYAIFAGFYSNEFYFPLDTSLYLDVDWLAEEVIMQELTRRSHRMMGEAFEVFEDIKGIRYPAILEMAAGVIELVSGRTFTTEEVENGHPVMLIPEGFALANGLGIGSMITFEQRIYETFDDFTGRFIGLFRPGAQLRVAEEVQLEVIGIFRPTVEMNDEMSLIDFLNHVELNGRRMYVPFAIADANFQFYRTHVEIYFPEQLDYFPETNYHDIVFVLDDPLHLEAFNVAATAFIPPFYVIEDLRTEFGHMTDVLAQFQGISTGLFIGTILGSFALLGLLILLFLSDSKVEVGIYLALGMPKVKIICQMLIEVLIVTTFALVVSLLTGHLMAQRLTYMMLNEQLITHPFVVPNELMIGRDFNAMGFGIQMTAEQMVEAYDFTLGQNGILAFFVSFVFIMMLATILPTTYLLKLKSKDIL